MEQYLQHCLQTAYNMGASDIHFTVGIPPVFRCDGDLRKVGDQALSPEDTETIAKEILPREEWAILVEKGEVDYSYSMPGVSRFRVNVYFQRSHIALALRVLPVTIPTVEELQLPHIIKQIATLSQGLILVTGPTGSGKSTTLAAIIRYINETMSKHIVTLEQPIEYLHQHGNCIIEQREIGQDTQNFSSGLRAALRQDPDCILVGEMRDMETMQTALSAAETGHLVLATLHTIDAPSTIHRILDSFPGNQQPQIRSQLASVCQAIIAQRLLPRREGGRVVALEILTHTNSIANLIRNDKIHQIPNVLMTSKQLGMQTMSMHVQSLLRESVITSEIAAPFLVETRYS
ncbi:type IV pilus twitching motility protein PilT [Bacillus fonticola]|uniref:type IV pilus twitching motility protein PilT n=1 Tax=Bacillus fonticola TaxID=2728853 RepID=UPI0014737FCA|nr:type IV pilus twitching motility protein PilT [Bacillus fonticola]